MSRSLAVIILAVISLSAKADDKISLYGRVQDATWKTDLIDAVVVTYDNDGNPLDSIPTNQGRRYRNGEMVVSSSFYISVPRVDSTYVFDVVCDKYLTKTVSFRVENIGKRETSRDIPIIFMERAPHKLGEVTVTASKIKFYNKGDTLVYNADAFLLAEGSMLDALISQLPGVELNNNGEIKVNGEKVETLLLNGKEFFDGDNNLMLENIGAYTVKTVNIYSDQTPQDKKKFDKLAPKVLTMDVRLKKEYQNGYIMNAQGGYGTEDRYLGRMFASWFNNNTRVALIANANNLNDNRTPGKNDTWTPDMMPNGKREYRSAGVNVTHSSSDDKTNAQGSLRFSQTKNNSLITNNRINFLPGGDTYENSFGDSRLTDTQVNFSSYYGHSGEKFSHGTQIGGIYYHSKGNNSNLSGSFSEDPGEMSRQILDAIYSDGTPEMLDILINRSNTKTDTWNRVLNGSIWQNIGYSIPRTNDRISLAGMISYASTKNNVWRDYDINFGSDPGTASRRRQYTDNTPNHALSAYGVIRYSTYMFNTNMAIAYEFQHDNRTDDSYMYALERLNDMGIYGTLPEGYESCLMPQWSHASRTITNTHKISGQFMYFHQVGKGHLAVMAFPSINFTDRSLRYYRDGQAYPLSTNNTSFVFQGENWNGNISYRFQKNEENGQTKFRNLVSYELDIRPQLPDMVNMIDIINDADPLNIYLGNPDLKPQYTFANNLKWKWTPFTHALNNTFHLHYSEIKNKLVNGYSYDMSTGIRRNRMYNTDGNWSFQVLNTLNWQFGSTKQFTLSNDNSLEFSGYSDMIGVNSIEPEQTKVRFRSFRENLNFSWQIGPHSVKARFDYLNRHTSSTQPGFRTLDANHVNFGVIGSAKLPAGFSMSTDFMCYTRRGYGSKELDTTDPIWNMRISYAPPRNSHWIFMVDAFDLLHKLSNVNYAVTASGRTITYTNALPRYVLFSLQYRFNIQPKKR